MGSLLLTLSIFLVFEIAFASEISIVDLGYAKYSATLNKTSGNTPFLAIRFAAPPTGSFRWQPPQPPAFTAGVQKADMQPPMCFQAARGASPSSPFRTGNWSMTASLGELPKRQIPQPFPSSEDCLFLNIWTPGTLSQRLSSGSLPVVVWIHGGGYTLGAASGVTGTGLDIFSGDDLIAEADGGIVVVVIQYRLGLFGFLAGNEVKEHGVLNAGLLDQEFALQWVQTHIHKFGGDPSKVTVWGESAGAGSVLQHMIANGGKTTSSLFRGGISSSMFIPSQYWYNDTVPEGLFTQVVQQTGCASARNKLACLRFLPTGTLSTANIAINHAQFFATFAFVPVVDGTFIKERPSVALRRKSLNAVENVMAIYNAHEGTHFVDTTQALPSDPGSNSSTILINYISQLFPTLNERDIAKATKLYTELEGSSLLELMELVFGEAVLICPSYLFIRPFQKKPFTGSLAIPPASHLDDVSFYFPSQKPSLFPNKAFARAFSHAFLDFAKGLDPNMKSSPTITPRWMAWDGATRHEMLFNRTEGNPGTPEGAPDLRIRKTDKRLLNRCEFWESIGEKIGL